MRYRDFPSRLKVPAVRRHQSAVNWTVAVLAIVVAALIPFVTGGYILFQLELVFLYIGAASGLNLAVGYSGEFLLCQATVVGVAAYVAGVLSVLHNWSPIAKIGR